MSEQKYYRHGDLLLLKIAEIPDNIKNGRMSIRKTPKAHKRGAILAEGEVTGHFHTIDVPVEEYYHYEFKGGKISFFRIDSPAKLEHEEHGTILLEPGIYQVNFQKELQPLQANDMSPTAMQNAVGHVRD